MSSANRQDGACHPTVVNRNFYGIVREQIHSTVPPADFMAEIPFMAPLQERHIPQRQAVTPVRLVDFIMAD